MKTCPTCKMSYPSSSTFCSIDGAKLEEADVLAVGTIVRGKYRILEKVGEGGMGEVYKALHIGFDEPRALKMMSDELMKERVLVERFKHEAFIARKLQHPNVVRVDDIDVAEDGRPFIVMEFIEGRSLKSLIESQGCLPPARVAAIIKQVAVALDAAHSLGMIHRDIKPDNIALVDKSGEKSGTSTEVVKVLDFGIAKLKEAHGGKLPTLTLTGSGMVIGTAQYMSPEQAAGKGGEELDGRSDVYSLGIVMYQMLTGALPFQAKTAMDMVLAHMQTPPMPIRSVRSDISIPEPLADLVMKCLAKDRTDRPASAAEVAEAISRWEQKTPGASMPAAKATEPSAAEFRTMAAHPARLKESPPIPKPARASGQPGAHAAAAGAEKSKSSKALGLGAAAALLLIVGGITAWKMTSRGPAPGPAAPPSAQELELQSEAGQLLKDHKIDEAITKWQAIDSIHGPMAGQAQDEIARLRNLEQQEKDLFAQGQSAQEAKKWDEAESDYKQVIQLDGALKDKADQALQAVQAVKALMTAGNNVDLKKIERDEFDSGQRAFNQKQFVEARQDFQQVVALNLEGSSLRPQAQLRLQGVDRAIADAERVADAKKAQETALAARKQALDNSLQQFNSLKSQRKYDEARALLTTIDQLGGDSEGLNADLSSAVSAEWRELQSKRHDADQHKDLQALQNLQKGYEDLSKRDSGDPQWANRSRDVAENQIPDDIRALSPGSPTASAPTTGQPARSQPQKLGKQPDISLMNPGHTTLTSPFNPNQVYQQNLLDAGFHLESKPDLSSVGAPSGATVTTLLEIGPDGQVVKLFRCMPAGPYCQAIASAPGWKFSNPSVNGRPARAIAGVVVKF